MDDFKTGDKVVATKGTRKGQKGVVQSIRNMTTNSGEVGTMMSVSFNTGETSFGAIKLFREWFGLELLDSISTEEKSDWANLWDQGAE